MWRPHPAEAGEQAQIDYGQLGRWLDPVTGKLRTVQAFVMVLACSRHMFVRPVLKMDQRAWTECHVAAFEFFGGVPARLVPDNLKTGVDKPDLYDPKLNRSYAEMAAHYGCLIDPARSQKPRDKPRSNARCRMCGTRSGAAGSSRRCRRCRPRPSAGRWRSPGSVRAGRWTGAAPAAVFEAVEKQALRPLPRGAVRAGHVGDGEDRPGHPRPGGQGAVLRPVAAYRQDRRRARHRAPWCSSSSAGDLVKTHPRKIRGKQTDFGDYPPEKIAFHMRTPVWCRKQAAAASARHASRSSRELLADNALYRLRSAQGIIGLADKHDPARLEAACAKAIAAGDPSYRTIKGILAAGAERDQLPAAAGDAGAAAFLRGPASFANVVPMPGAITSDAGPPRGAGHVMTAVTSAPGAPAPPPAAAAARPAAGRPGARAARRRRVHRAGRHRRPVPDHRPRTRSPSRCPLTWPARPPGQPRSRCWPPPPAARRPATPAPARPAAGSSPDGQIAGHHARIFTAITEAAP